MGVFHFLLSLEYRLVSLLLTYKYISADIQDNVLEMLSYKHLISFSSCLCNYYAGYKVIKKIGEGTFSEVVKTQSLKDGKFYACKTMKQTINRYVF